MSVLTNLLSWVSAGLLVPVLVTMAGLLGFSLIMVGDFLAASVQRRRSSRQIQKLSDDLIRTPVRLAAAELQGDTEIARVIRRCGAVSWHPIHADKFISDFELESRRGLDGPQALIRLGPMLGLMGALIPIGPALAGLAAGDLSAMAANVEEGLTATVCGLFVGGLGFWVRLVRSRWAMADVEMLHYAYELAQDQAAEPARVELGESR
ncbi:MotA/TolQ/ExbB proton channel family protein [Aquisphaera insulae]|uniref:MotA/TolQ/ExbB proton channel family protein n=1 Tax=Aquisphaera insulae TaxID=2712864 RepID=UPI0013E9A53A|nr:MotA/TolQ/ExbB proton channel family protein [Aquisphaera insulae]